MEIDGMTPRMQALADIMWHIDSLEELEYWLTTLTKKDAMLCMTIMKCMLHEKIEEELVALESYPQAADVLARFSVAK
jgi:hypothetical protein